MELLRKLAGMMPRLYTEKDVAAAKRIEAEYLMERLRKEAASREKEGSREGRRQEESTTR